MVKVLQVQEFADLFGTTADDFNKECLDFIKKADFRYTELEGEERDRVILDILKKIDSGQLRIAGKEGKADWEKGWSENLQNFIQKGYDLIELVPKYVRPNQALRLYKNYIVSLEANFELNFFTVFRLWLFSKYLKGFDVIYEFACGTGYNLSLLSRLFPEKELYGLDWTKASVDIVNILNKKHGMKIKGRIFDMFSPDYSLAMQPNSAVISIGGLEQLGKEHNVFTQFLLKKRPRLCIHVEPIYELYDEGNLADYLAAKFHKARKYLEGFLINLEILEKEKKIEIVKKHRMYFGSLYHDGWSMVIWKPL